jgi:APA family basic amino acid/polyamine antiporter
VILVSLYGQTRIFYAMSRDGFLPATFARVHPKYNTPAQSTLVIGVFVALIAGIFPLNVLGELVSVGTLLAFMFVCTAVIILRETRPKVRRPFRVPFYPLTPILGILVCGAMVYPLLEESWLRLVGWLAIGVVIYVIYGARHAKKPTWSLDDAPEEKS